MFAAVNQQKIIDRGGDVQLPNVVGDEDGGETRTAQHSTCRYGR